MVQQTSQRRGINRDLREEGGVFREFLLVEDQLEEAVAAAKEGSDANESILGDLIHHHDNSNNLQGGTSSLLLLARISIVHIFSNIYHVVP